MHQQVFAIMKSQEDRYKKAFIDYLSKKEQQLRLVMEELTYRAAQDDPKDKIITRLTAAINKIEIEGNEVLDHVVTQNERIRRLEEKTKEEESDKIFLFSKAKE